MDRNSGMRDNSGVTLLKIYFNSFIPEKYKNIIFINNSLERYEARVMNLEGKWYILNDRLKILSTEELEKAVNSLNLESERRGFTPNAFLKEKTIYRGATPPTSSLLNRIAEIKGTFICPIALVGLRDINIGFEYDQEMTREVTNAILDFENETKLSVEIVKMGEIDNYNISSYQYFHNLANYDTSLSRVVSLKIFSKKDDKVRADEDGKYLTIKPKFLGIGKGNEYNDILIGKIKESDLSHPFVENNKILMENKVGNSIEFKADLLPPLVPLIVLANELTLPLYMWFNIYGENLFEANFIVPETDLNLFLRKFRERSDDIEGMGFNFKFSYVGKVSDYFNIIQI